MGRRADLQEFGEALLRHYGRVEAITPLEKDYLHFMAGRFQEELGDNSYSKLFDGFAMSQPRKTVGGRV
jgi:hypothetical protein